MFIMAHTHTDDRTDEARCGFEIQHPRREIKLQQQQSSPPHVHTRSEGVTQWLCVLPRWHVNVNVNGGCDPGHSR
jgi:hypothetical protein